MRARTFAMGMVLAAALLGGAIGIALQAPAQADDIDRLNADVRGLMGQGKFAEALALAGRSIDLTKVRHGEDHPRYVTAIKHLVQLLYHANLQGEAEPLYRRALAIWENVTGLAKLAEPANVALDLVGLANVLQATNRHAEAESLYHRALAMEKRLKEYENHPVLALTGIVYFNKLSSRLQDGHRLAEAEPFCRHALALAEKSLGPDHPSVATSLNNLAQLLRTTNRHAEAEPLYRRALAIDEKSYGPDHPSVARDLNNMAELLRATNRPDEADLLHRRALAIREKSRMSDHPSRR